MAIGRSAAARHTDAVEYALGELERFFDKKPENHLIERDVYVFASFMTSQLEKLRLIAEEIDEEYASAA